MYPPTTGIHFNGGGILNDDFTTLAEVFKTRGYRTGAFIGAWVLNSTFGLSQGFDRYDDVGDDGESSSTNHERSADRVCDSALAWLDEQPQTPFFAWVHFFDPHHPYAPPAAFWEKPTDPYDGEIAFADSQIRRLLDWLDARKLRPRTLIVATSDHGEAFREHGEIEHGLFLYDTTTHVPLIFSYPSRLPQGRAVSATVRLVDVVPTILDLMDWPAMDDLPGNSLRTAIEADAFDSLPAYGETEYPKVAFGWASLHSYTTGRWKFIDAPRPELYDRIADPAELTNVIDEHSEVAARLQADLEGLLATVPRRDAQSMNLDEDALRALESLGYVGVPTIPAVSNTDQPRRDPKDMLAVYHGLLEGRRLTQQRSYREVVRLLDPLVAQSPESDEVRAVLGEAYLKLGMAKEAEREYRASLRTVPTNPRKLCRLGDALLQQQRIAEATECYERALQAFDNYGLAHNRLGAIYLRRNQIAKAYEHFRRHVDASPTSPNALTNLANVLPRMGRHQEAVDLLHRALQQDPDFAPAHYFLWQVFMASQERSEAIKALRTACRVLPDDVPLRRNLAGLLSTTPRIGPSAAREALDLAIACCEADPGVAENLDVLAMAYAATGDFAEAAEAAQRALTLAEDQGKTQLADQIAIRLQAYQHGRTR
jgi:tetratricopeptide (TPR) repeat protein